MINHNAEHGWLDVPVPATTGDTTAALELGERARTNLALLYGGTGRAPLRVLIAPAGRLQEGASRPETCPR